MKLIELLNEGKEENFQEFAEKRLGGATKIVDNAKEKGGPSMLTYHHFVVKLPHYKKASDVKFKSKNKVVPEVVPSVFQISHPLIFVLPAKKIALLHSKIKK